MYKNYQVVCNTAAGRRRYMQYLIPPIVANDLVDRYDIWVNTMDKQDVAFFRRIAEIFPKINLVWQPDNLVNGIASINAFYKECVEENTIYIKMDDDVVWLEPDYFEKMLDFRLKNSDYFIVSPLVINNPLSTYILQNKGFLKLDKYYKPRPNSAAIWRSGAFAVQLHQWFLTNYLKTNRYSELYCGLQPVALNRFSINSILWFGEDMKGFSGEIPGDDEEYLTCIKPVHLNKSNCFNGDCIISHFAFSPQRICLDSCKILEQYGDFLFQSWEKDDKMKGINNSVHEAITFVEQNRDSILNGPEVYPNPVPRKKTTIKTIFKKVQAYVHNFVYKHSKHKYIYD